MRQFQGQHCVDGVDTIEQAPITQLNKMPARAIKNTSDEQSLMLAAILQATEPTLIAPTELAFGKTDLGSAMGTDQLLGQRWLCVDRRSRRRCIDIRREWIFGQHNRWCWHGCNGNHTRLHEVGQRQQVGGAVLANQFFTPLFDRLWTAHVGQYLERIEQARLAVVHFFVPLGKHIGLHDH